MGLECIARAFTGQTSVASGPKTAANGRSLACGMNQRKATASGARSAPNPSRNAYVSQQYRFELSLRPFTRASRPLATKP